MENIRHIQNSSMMPRFGAVTAAEQKKYQLPAFGQDKDSYTPTDKKDSAGGLKRFGLGLKNGFLHAAEYFRPDNKKQILFDVLVGAGIGLVSAIGTPVFLVTGPACIGLMMSISLMMRFARGLLTEPEQFAMLRQQLRGKDVF